MLKSKQHDPECLGEDDGDGSGGTDDRGMLETLKG